MDNFSIGKFLTYMAYPLCFSLILGVLALVLERLDWRRTAFWLGATAILWLYACSTSVVSSFLIGLLERNYMSRALSVVPEADAIVLLGGAMRGDTHMGTLADLNHHADRLIYAAELYKAGKAPVLLLSGGAPFGDRPEAEQMREVLGVMGIPPHVPLLENQSRNTHDNAVNCARLLQARNLHTVLLVTSAYHMPRAVAAFKKQGINVIPAPTDYQRLVGPPRPGDWLPTADSLTRSTTALHEMGGYLYYAWRGWL